MVIYDLTCRLGHVFEAWFKDAQSFEKQKRAGLVQCAVCGTSDVKALPSGCHFGAKAGKEATRVETREDPPGTVAGYCGQTQVDPVVLLKTVQKFVRDHCKNVGKEFTKKAIQMKRGEVAAEPIYGTATEKDRDWLDEEGVSYLPLPKLPESLEN